jgi:hypothetical protein
VLGEPFEYRPGMVLEFQIAVPAARAAVDPVELLVGDD